MRRRVITTTKVLSVAFALTGCSTSDASKIDASEIDARSEPTPEASAVASQVVAPSVSAPLASTDPKLLGLGIELGSTDRAKALANLDHFRPLCDANGYPLVGNFPSKGMEPTNPLPVADVCAQVRNTPGR